MHMIASNNFDQPTQDQPTKQADRKRTQGYVIECDSRRGIISAPVDSSLEHMQNFWSVGQQLSISVGDSRIICQCYKVESSDQNWNDKEQNQVRVHVEFIGEIQQNEFGIKFTSGITQFPQMGCIAHPIRGKDLEAIYENDAKDIITIGNLTQSKSIEAKIDVNKLLSRHFAVVGSTGVGKSTSVTLMLRKIIEARKDIRVLMLDPHNEFGAAFPNKAIVISADQLKLPFWMFGLAEFAEVIFRGQKGMELETELLRELIVEAKEQYKQERQSDKNSTAIKSKSVNNISADSPVPYRIPDLMKLIDARLGLLDNKSEKPLLKTLAEKISTISVDLRFQFMFDKNACGGDKIEEIISKIFRLPQNDLPICVLEMSGLPAEVVSSVVSVLCRLAFDLAVSSEGAIQTLVVCEEAHRYIPADIDAGFWPTRQSIGRIAKEGRKYGVYLGIITQRPGELDPTILSQCNTFFAMRLSNQKDQEIIAGAFNSGAQSTINFLPSISNRECIAFGEALHSPMRMTFETVLAKDLPGANIRQIQEDTRAGKVVNLQGVISKMRKENAFASLYNDDDGININGQSSLQVSGKSIGVEQRDNSTAQKSSNSSSAHKAIADIRASAATWQKSTYPNGRTVEAPSEDHPLNGYSTPMPAPAPQHVAKRANAGNSLIDKLRRG
ncbi:MAG: ATPase [Hyphomicrobiales bacterium]|nr:MAG: ATPase [Hyphomicrobiales bacterium]